VGRALIQEGLASLKALGAQGCCLVGHPGYYQQFGFRNTIGSGAGGRAAGGLFRAVFDGHLPRGTVMFHEGIPRHGPGAPATNGAALRQSVETRQEATHAKMVSFPAPGRALVAAALLGACAGTATTRVTLTPPDQAPVCQPQAALKASVLWRTQWRADQKDVPDREAAAAQGITRFFADGGCFPWRRWPAPRSVDRLSTCRPDRIG
jgi:hypothetical protein